MHRQPRRLVDHQQVGILVDDRQRDIFCLWNGVDRRRYQHAVGLAFPDPEGCGGDGQGIEQDAPLLQQRLQPRAGQIGQCKRQGTIDAQARELGIDQDAISGSGEVCHEPSIPDLPFPGATFKAPSGKRIVM